MRTMPFFILLKDSGLLESKTSRDEKSKHHQHHNYLDQYTGNRPGYTYYYFDRISVFPAVYQSARIVPRKGPKIIPAGPIAIFPNIDPREPPRVAHWPVLSFRAISIGAAISKAHGQQHYYEKDHGGGNRDSIEVCPRKNK